MKFQINIVLTEESYDGEEEMESYRVGEAMTEAEAEAIRAKVVSERKNEQGFVEVLVSPIYPIIFH
tara:strand:- start:5955 stop:6152 length:198 start_codon:yes stop_codon:yes gene_type:complete